MNIGFSLDDVGVVFGLCVVALAVPIVLLMLGSLVGRIIGLSSGWFTLIFALVVGVGALYGGSLYLDSAGHAVPGRIFSKDERIHIREQGDWEHTLQTSVRYRLDGVTPTGAAYAPDESQTALHLSSAQFDGMREGDAIALRVVPLWRSVALVRLASLHTRDLIPLAWYPLGAAVVLTIWLVPKIASTRFGIVALAVIVLAVAITVPSVVIARQWRAMEDLAAKPLRAQATVRDVQRITRIDPLPCSGGDCSSSNDTAFDVSQQYDIVQFTFQPQGARDAVIGVDAADAGTFGATAGGTVPIAYAAADPRAAQLIGATHTHHWKNMVTFVWRESTTLLLLAAGVVIAGVVARGFQRLVRRRVGTI